MMNFLALGLVLTSLVTAGFFSPSPENPRSREDVIVKEGHRVVVVEYEKDDGNTKVLISPQDSQKGFAGDVKDKLSEKMEGVKEGAASSVLDGVKKAGDQGEEALHKFRPRELVCDAYGKCKHKIASAFERTKEAAAEKVSEAEEAVGEAAGKVKDTVADTARKASDKVREARENVKDSASEVSSKAKEKASGVKEEAGKKLEGAKDVVSEAAKEAEEGARRVRKEGQKELRVILRHARDLAGDIFNYVAPPEKVSPVAGILHLMGFAAAYGMCVWITFASSYVLAGALPRQQFAMVQSKIYPVYFKAMGYSVGLALLGHLVGPSRRFSPTSVAALQGLNLASSLVMILTNLLWLEPRATKVMLERMKMEKEEGPAKDGPAVMTTRLVSDSTGLPAVGASRPVPDSTAEMAGRGPSGEEAVARSQIIRLSQTLQSLNSYSSFLNALTLVSLTWHLVHLSQLMRATC